MVHGLSHQGWTPDGNGEWAVEHGGWTSLWNELGLPAELSRVDAWRPGQDVELGQTVMIIEADAPIIFDAPTLRRMLQLIEG